LAEHTEDHADGSPSGGPLSYPKPHHPRGRHHHQEGTRRIYQVDPAGVGELRRYLDRFWDTALRSFQQHTNSKNKGT
jgi:hypothetical protein